MSKVIFYDLQTGGFSAHTTIDGMFDMQKEESLACCEEEEVAETKNSFENMSLEEKREFIESLGYEIIDTPTSEDIQDYENYHETLMWNDGEPKHKALVSEK